MAIKSFVGRETELQVLGSYISRISEAEQRRIVFITGEAGVGKSELISQIRDKVFKECPDIRLATAYCNELSGGGDPYQPFFNILDDLVTTEKREEKGKFSKFILEMGPEWVQVIPGIGSLVSAAWKTTQWVKTEHLNKAALDIPPAIGGVIEKRIGFLRNEIRRLLQYASVEGEKFSSFTLARFLYWEELTLLEELEILERIHKLIEKLESEGLLTKSGMQYQFIHSLIHKSFYNSLNVRQKQLLHKKLGNILETEYRDDIEKIATQLAVHFEKGQQLDKATEYRVIAARKANDLYSLSESAEHCQNGLTLLDRLEDSNTNRQKRIDLLLEWGRADGAIGKVDEAIGRYASCEALSLSIDDKQRLSNVYYRWGSELYRKSDYEGSIEYLKESLQLREELSDRAGIADELEAQGINYTYYQDRWRDALEVFERSQQVREELGDHRGKDPSQQGGQ